MKLVTVPEMLAIEKEADASGLSYAEMMENAGSGLADTILELLLTRTKSLEAFGLVGPGNNGGDTLVALEHLANNGWKTRAYLIKRKADDLVKRLKKQAGKFSMPSKMTNSMHWRLLSKHPICLLDGVLGTGINLPLKEDVCRTADSRQRCVGCDG